MLLSLLWAAVNLTPAYFFSLPLFFFLSKESPVVPKQPCFFSLSNPPFRNNLVMDEVLWKNKILGQFTEPEWLRAKGQLKDRPRFSACHHSQWHRVQRQCQWQQCRHDNTLKCVMQNTMLGARYSTCVTRDTVLLAGCFVWCLIASNNYQWGIIFFSVIHLVHCH